MKLEVTGKDGSPLTLTDLDGGLPRALGVGVFFCDAGERGGDGGRVQ